MSAKCRKDQKKQFLKSALGALIVIQFWLPPVAQAETLEDALISAYNHSPKLKAERARLREIDESYIQARAQGKLTSSITGTMSLDATNTPGLEIPIPGFDNVITSGTTVSTPIAAQVQIIQPIYQGGRVSALKSQAMSSIEAAREGLRAQETQWLLDTANAFVDVLRYEEQARIRRNNLQVLMRQKEAADSRFEVGAGTRTDMAQAEARMAGARVGLAQAEAQLQISRADYRRLTGHMPEGLQALPRFVLPNSEAEAVELAHANNPGLMAAIYNEAAGDARIKAAKSANKPIVALTGNLSAIRGQAGFPDRAESAVIGAQVTVPLTTGGLNRSRVREAENARTRLTFETRDAKFQLNAAIMQAWAGLQAAQEGLKASQIQVQAAELAFEGVQLEKDVGRRTALDVLNAEQEVLEARLSVINSRSEVEKAGFTILALTGGFDAISLSLPTDYYDPQDNLNAIIADDNFGFIDDILPEKWR